MAVHAADHQVEFGQGVVGEVHGAVFEDVALDAGEDADAGSALAVDVADLAGEVHHALFVEAVGHGEGLGVVGDGDVLVAQGARGLGHFEQGGAAVGLGGVHVEVAAQVAKLDELGQAAFGGGFDFARILAQLGRNPGQAERFVDAGFGFASHFEIVVFAAREILHGGAETAGRERTNIHLQALAAHLGAGFILAAAENFFHARVGDEAVERRGGVRAGDQQVEIAYGFAPAPQAAGGGHGFHTGHGTELGHEFGGHGIGIAEQITAAALAVLGDGAKHLLFQLGAHAREHAQLLFAAEALELIHGADAVVFQDEGDALGAEPLNLEEFEGGGRKFLQQQIAALAGAMVDDFADDGGQSFADAGNVGDFAGRVAEDAGDAFGVALNGGGAVAVAANTKGILGGDLHQVGRLPQYARDFLVLQTGPRSQL